MSNIFQVIGSTQQKWREHDRALAHVYGCDADGVDEGTLHYEAYMEGLSHGIEAARKVQDLSKIPEIDD